MTTRNLSIGPVARRLLGDSNRAQSTNVVWRYGRKGSLAVDLTKNTWFDHEVGEGGGVLDLICRENGGSRRKARDWLRDEMGLIEDRISHQRKSSKSVRRRMASGANTPTARRIWAETIIPENTAAESYLACRGIVLPIPPDLRYHPTKDALIAALRNRSGSIISIQQILFRQDLAGIWKRDRKSLGPVRGNAVRLTPPASILQLTESVEDGLALHQMTNRATWAVPGAGNLASFEPPPEVREVVLSPDNDAAGRKAIEAAAPRLIELDLHVEISLPPGKGQDWCSILEAFEERAAIIAESESISRQEAEMLALGDFV